MYAYQLRSLTHPGHLGVPYPYSNETIRAVANVCWFFCLFLVSTETDLHAQKPPYDIFPPAEPPYYRVRYEASQKPGELAFPVNYTIWIPQGVKTLGGVIV